MNLFPDPWCVAHMPIDFPPGSDPDFMGFPHIAKGSFGPNFGLVDMVGVGKGMPRRFVLHGNGQLLGYNEAVDQYCIVANPGCGTARPNFLRRRGDGHNHDLER
jgi:hypothetical protein